MYARDTFFQLSSAGQIGLAILSLMLALFMIWLAFKVFRQLPRFNFLVNLPLRLIIALTLLWAFIWLSPQIYYAYYLIIFNGLPWQIVVSLPPTITDLSNLLFFQGPKTLSQHSKAVFGWGLILYGTITATKQHYRR